MQIKCYAELRYMQQDLLHIKAMIKIKFKKGNQKSLNLTPMRLR